MRRLGIALALSLAAGSALAQTKEPIQLRDMGSFHVGGRLIEIKGQPIREVVFTPGGVPAKIDPNGTYQVEQMYVQYFLPQNRKGKLPLLLWHGGGLTGVTYETKPDGGAGWLQLLHPQGLGRLPLGRHGARPLRLDQYVPGRTDVPAARRSVGALPHRRAPAPGTPTRPSARPIRARNSRSRPTSSS